MKEIVTVTIEIDEDSAFHSFVGTGSLIDLMQEAYGSDTGIKVISIEKV
jgi:hypothetical protein